MLPSKPNANVKFPIRGFFQANFPCWVKSGRFGGEFLTVWSIEASWKHWENPFSYTFVKIDMVIFNSVLCWLLHVQHRNSRSRKRSHGRWLKTEENSQHNHLIFLFFLGLPPFSFFIRLLTRNLIVITAIIVICFVVSSRQRGITE